MDKEITIKIPEGFEIDTNKSSLTEGKIIFKKKENSLPTTNEEAVKFLPETCYYINNNGDINITEDYRKDPNTIATKELAEAFLALMQLVKFRDIWNGGWKPNFEDDEDKHIIYFELGKKITSTFTYSQCLLSFKSEELRDKFSETFDGLIQTAKPLL
jgi:hypothetical protein